MTSMKRGPPRTLQHNPEGNDNPAHWAPEPRFATESSRSSLPKRRDPKARLSHRGSASPRGESLWPRGYLARPSSECGIVYSEFLERPDVLFIDCDRFRLIQTEEMTYFPSA